MRLIPALCCSALINPFYFMVEVPISQYSLALRLLRLLSSLMAGGVLAQTLGCLVAYFVIGDPQAAGMLAHLLMQHLSYYFLGCGFIILSLSNILIKRSIFSRLSKSRTTSKLF
jgi:hypothetical protein